MEMDVSARNDADPQRGGVKRKHAGDDDDEEREMRRPTKCIVTSATSTHVPDARSSRELSAVENDGTNDNDDKEEYYRTLYTSEPDFRLLAQRDPDFQAVLEPPGSSAIDFANPASVMQLTKSLLKQDFGLSVDLPPDRLCPPVPIRHCYILWLKDLLDSTAPGDDPRSENVTGLDIGTGASLIYPLLGCAQRASWKFVATDIDAKSLSYARDNTARNWSRVGGRSRIRVLARTPDDPLIPLLDDDDNGLGIKTLDFTMVNPPFYSSATELSDLARLKSRPPNSACTGAPNEMVCEGGEVGFVRRLVDESRVLRGRVRWYTAMLGKQSSLEALVPLLKRDLGVTNYAITAFAPGRQTRRWGVAWSFGDRRPSLSACRGAGCVGVAKRLLPPPTEMVVAVVPTMVADLERAVRDAMDALDLVSWTWDAQLATGVGFVCGNVWSRAYRRRRKHTPKDNCSREKAPTSITTTTTTREQPQSVEPDVFRFSITITTQKSPGPGEGEIGGGGGGGNVTVTARWLQGSDYTLFESFTGFLQTCIRMPA
ncbi:uncharacterized protein GGS25DRAFT_470863 [Hypoxylon fragiforme]|uniref:uncharacterized protein n=1 Tax=Hypoxylon fragiforme TaxID=63214 RepID=UPI0020C68BF4|nr:uncharacterized protein GGS25DRAFT_470863 [Hypoxylon fragiforme]KAI2614239.1 hypothetical protein GGS25DRAFT_470863 [Hypoxylon fragiforme]